MTIISYAVLYGQRRLHWNYGSKRRSPKWGHTEPIYPELAVWQGGQSPSLACGRDSRADGEGGMFFMETGRLRSAPIVALAKLRVGSLAVSILCDGSGEHIWLFSGWPWIGSRGCKKGSRQSWTDFRPFWADCCWGCGLAFWLGCCKVVGQTFIVIYGLAVVFLCIQALKIKHCFWP